MNKTDSEQLVSLFYLVFVSLCCLRIKLFLHNACTFSVLIAFECHLTDENAKLMSFPSELLPDVNSPVIGSGIEL